MKDFLKKARAKAMLVLMSKGQKITDVIIDEIPNEWSNFLNTKDLWVNVDFPENQNTTACIYIGKKGSILNPHKHNDNVEHLVILNKEGKLKVVTETYMSEFSFPQSVYLEQGEAHAVQFLEDTKILIMWHPKFKKGWDAEFLKEEAVV